MMTDRGLTQSLIGLLERDPRSEDEEPYAEDFKELAAQLKQALDALPYDSPESKLFGEAGSQLAADVWPKEDWEEIYQREAEEKKNAAG